jgi:hypothetical protein
MHAIDLDLYGEGPEEFANIETIPIAGYVIHPDYNDWTLENDFALIQLQSASELYANEVVELDSPSEDPELASGDDLVVFGFGVLSSVSMTDPNVMQEVTLEYISNEECDSVFNVTGFVPSSMMCGQRNGVGSCFVRNTVSHSTF